MKEPNCDCRHCGAKSVPSPLKPGDLFIINKCSGTAAFLHGLTVRFREYTPGVGRDPHRTAVFDFVDGKPMNRHGIPMNALQLSEPKVPLYLSPKQQG